MRRDFIRSQIFEAPDVLFVQEAKAEDDVKIIKEYLEKNENKDEYECHPTTKTTGDAFIFIRQSIGGSFKDVTLKLSKKYVHCHLQYF